MNDEAYVSFCKRTYSLDQLKYLRECLKSNDGSISTSVMVFLDNNMADSKDALWWVDWAEKIKDDPSFPEKHFAKLPTSKKTFSVLYPYAE